MNQNHVKLIALIALAGSTVWVANLDAKKSHRIAALEFVLDATQKQLSDARAAYEKRDSEARLAEAAAIRYNGLYKLAKEAAAQSTNQITIK